ncbi:hypothetical protein [Chitinophaga sp.]|uniref:hypothetical protein n=1 Tax=Chitinophaga sp. TaxID=1869181 RepID=UPI0031D7EFF7
MKKFLLPVLFLAMPVTLSAQGWWPANRYDKLKPGGDPGKTAILNLFVDWAKKSYTPGVKYLGSYQRYNLDWRYGVAFDTWQISAKPDANGQPKPEGETNETFYIDVNAVPGSYVIDFINKPGQDMYFTWPPDGYAATKWFYDQRKGSNPRITPNAYPYITRVNDWLTVFLAPGNQLPFTPVTKGELLEKALAAATDEYWKNKIKQLQIRHRTSLNEPAVINALQCRETSFETDPDIFDPHTWAFQETYKQNYPVYKLTAATIARCKAQPLWVSVCFQYHTAQDPEKGYAIYKAMTEHINFTYIYNYFFAPEKVKGIGYTPK